MQRITSEKAYGLGGPLKNVLIHIYLGSLDNRIKGPHVQFNENMIPLEKKYGAYSLIITAKGARFNSKTGKEKGMIKYLLPMADNFEKTPISLECDYEDCSSVEICFDVSTIQNVANVVKPIARATLLLRSPREGNFHRGLMDLSIVA